MKLLAYILFGLLVILQYDLWLGDGSLMSMWQLNRTLDAQRADIDLLQNRNDALAAEVQDLKGGVDSIEEQARSELGMIKPQETFVQIVEPVGKTTETH